MKEDVVKFKEGGHTLVFYRSDGDTKYSFLIEGEPILTEKLLSSVKVKRVREKSISFAVRGIFDKLRDINLLIKKPKVVSQNPITELAEAIQAKYGRNIETEVLSKVGEDHNPTISVALYLPNGNTYRATGSNKRIAKRLAAKKALEEEFN